MIRSRRIILLLILVGASLLWAMVLPRPRILFAQEAPRIPFGLNRVPAYHNASDYRTAKELGLNFTRLRSGLNRKRANISGGNRLVKTSSWRSSWN